MVHTSCAWDSRMGLLPWRLAQASAWHPGLQLHDAELLVPGQHLVVEGCAGLTPTTVQISIQPQPKLATKEKRTLALRLTP